MVEQLELFKAVDRTTRQEECRRKWIKNKCCGTIVGATGFGKTRVGLNCAQTLINKYPNFRILVVVPTDTLQKQWKKQLDERGLGLNCDVMVINTAVKEKRQYTAIILDEVHRYASDVFSLVFKQVGYKYILGLTATFERLDGKETLLAKYCPVIDTITLEDALMNGWVSPYIEYEVLIDVDNIDEWNAMNREFTEHYEFFNFNWDLINSLVGKEGWKNRQRYRDQVCPPDASAAVRKQVLTNITYHAMGFMRVMQSRKKFVNEHPKKIELARKIIEARLDKKIVTFSKKVAVAEQIGYGAVYTGKTSKKRSDTILDDFNNAAFGVLNSCEKINEGLDVKGLSVAIILGLDSAKLKAVQRVGRVIRYEAGKQAEIFNLILNNTVETKWFSNAHPDGNFKVIDEAGLEKVLKGEDPGEYVKPATKFVFRF